MVIKLLQNGKAAGVDKVRNELLKHAGDKVKRLLVHMFKNILMSGVVPENWNISKAILLLKRTPKFDLGNYRPITLSSCLSKLFVKILLQRLSIAMEEVNLLGNGQQGFRKGRSCQDNLFILQTLQLKQKMTRNKMHIGLIYLKQASIMLLYF